MLAFLLPLAAKIVKDAVAKVPDNEELGEKLVEICLLVLKKAVKLTKTDMDDQLLEVVTKAIQNLMWFSKFTMTGFAISPHQFPKSSFYIFRSFNYFS